MDGLSEFLDVVYAPGRKVYVAEREIDLRNLSDPNDIYILQLPEGSTAAGGRGGGFGERRIVLVYHFTIEGGACRKIATIEEEERLEALDLPYHATAMPITGADGKEKLVSGVVDPSFAREYRRVLA